jgi:hypothetical protein
MLHHSAELVACRNNTSCAGAQIWSPEWEPNLGESQSRWQILSWRNCAGARRCTVLKRLPWRPLAAVIDTRCPRRHDPPVGGPRRLLRSAPVVAGAVVRQKSRPIASPRKGPSVGRCFRGFLRGKRPRKQLRADRGNDPELEIRRVADQQMPKRNGDRFFSPNRRNFSDLSGGQST